MISRYAMPSGTVKARDVKVGMVLLRPTYGPRGAVPVRVVDVQHAAAYFDELAGKLRKANLSRKVAAETAEKLVKTYDALEVCGRLARLIWWEGMHEPSSFPAADELTEYRA